MANEEWISLADASAELGMSWARTWRRVLNGELYGKKIAGHWVVSARALSDYKLVSAKNKLAEE